jgi:hypothetical protein
LRVPDREDEERHEPVSLKLLDPGERLAALLKVDPKSEAVDGEEDQKSGGM